MNVPYDEDQVILFNKDVLAAYDKAKQKVNPSDASYSVWTGRMQFDAVDMGYGRSREKHLAELYAVLGLEKPANSFPLKPERSQIINVQANFCNLRDSEDIPIFEPFISQLIISNPPKANDWINRLRAAGSTHINLNLSGDYNENLGWAPRYPIPGADYTNRLDDFSGILDYVIRAGFIPEVRLAADGQGYDPVGMTHGYTWGMANIPTIISKLDKYVEYCLWSSGWDGCFPNWTPQQTVNFIRMMRDVVGTRSCISTEFSGPSSESVSYSHMGNAGSDWKNNQLDLLDVFEIELLKYPPNETGIAQVATRLLGSAAKNAPITPYYLNGIEKEIGIIFFETCAYQAIRKQITPNDAVAIADIGKKYGFTKFGNGLPATPA